MYAFKLGVLLLATVASMPVLCHENHDACSTVPEEDISMLNETEQIKVLEDLKINMTCGTMKRAEIDQVKRQEILRDTYCWGLNMMLKSDHKTELIRVYRSFLARTSDLYMESNDNIYMHLEPICNSMWADEVFNFVCFYGFVVLVLGLSVFGIYRIRTKINRNRPQESETDCYDGNEMVMVEIVSTETKGLKSCLPSKPTQSDQSTESGQPIESDRPTESDQPTNPKPKKAVTWTENEIREYDVHPEEDFRDPIKTMEREYKKMNRIYLRSIRGTVRFPDGRSINLN